jgi:RNA polymerase sigma-70 factor (ECF subfamily)
MDINEEKEIIGKINENPRLFGVFFDAYYQTIYKYILKRIADPTIAQDIASETFLKAMQHIHQFKWQGISICHWFYKIASNELRMYFRRNKYRSESLENLRESIGFEPENNQGLMEEIVEIQTAVERKNEFLEAQKILARLPVKYQEVITLRFMEEKKIKEISFILGKREGTIKSLLSRGLDKLRQEFEKQTVQPKSIDCIELAKVDGVLSIKST